MALAGLATQGFTVLSWSLSPVTRMPGKEWDSAERELKRTKSAQSRRTDQPQPKEKVSVSTAHVHTAASPICLEAFWNNEQPGRVQGTPSG